MLARGTGWPAPSCLSSALSSASAWPFRLAVVLFLTGSFIRLFSLLLPLALGPNSNPAQRHQAMFAAPPPNTCAESGRFSHSFHVVPKGAPAPRPQHPAHAPLPLSATPSQPAAVYTSPSAHHLPPRHKYTCTHTASCRPPAQPPPRTSSPPPPSFFVDTVAEGAAWLNPARVMARRLLSTGVALDSSAFLEAMRGICHDYTFAEAYAKTGRVVSISTSTPFSTKGTATLLNHVSAPNILVRSAVQVSVERLDLKLIVMSATRCPPPRPKVSAKRPDLTPSPMPPLTFLRTLSPPPGLLRAARRDAPSKAPRQGGRRVYFCAARGRGASLSGRVLPERHPAQGSRRAVLGHALHRLAGAQRL